MKKIPLILLMITLPISSLFLVWSYSVTKTYFVFDRIPNSPHRGERLHQIGWAEYYSLREKFYSSLGVGKKSDVNFFLKSSGLKSLNSNLPLSGGNDKKSYMLTTDSVIKGKLRYRGDNYYHWFYPKKSWRFKTSKNSLYNGSRKVNFIIPKGNALLHNHMSYELAKLLGLLSPESYLTDISVNNHYDGIKLFAEQIDESFLRKNGRMPNDIYRGDNMGQKHYKGVFVSLFENPSIWGKASYNNHYEKSSMKPLEKMIEDLPLDKYSIYDLDNFSKMAAFIDMTSTYHIDGLHNWVLYYDAYYERMNPIIWDPVGWWPETVNYNNVNIITSDLMASLYKNGDFLRQKYAVLNKFYSEEKIVFASTLAESSLTAKRYIEKNGYTIGGLRRVHLDRKNSNDAVDEFVKSVDKRLAKVEAYFIGGANKNDYKYAVNKGSIRLFSGGSKLIKRVTLESEEPLNNLNNIQIAILQNNEIKEFDVSNSVRHLTDYSISIDVELLPGAKIVPIKIGGGKWHKLAPSSVTYDIQLDGFKGNISNLILEIANKQHEKIAIKQVDHIELLAFQKGLNNIIYTNNKGIAQHWEGIKRFSGFNIINDDITITAGTKIILSEGATLKVFGKVTAIGTKEAPITFEAQDKTKPWNAFALKDERANGSVFKHCIFKDGSGDKGDLYEYTAMFSVHNVKDLLVEDSEFYDSHRTDDMVHVIYSDATFRNTKFVRSLSDALDVDISNIIVDNCEFIDSGNDSIDLMTTNAIVTNTRFLKSADKGISIGEGSNLLAINNYIEASEIGMQSKDTSVAYIYNSTFVGNKKAVDAYHKNWRYSEGGTITLDRSIFRDNTENATVGKRSKVIINASEIDSIDNFDAESLRKGKIVLSNEKTIAYSFEQDLFRGKKALEPSAVSGYHE